MNRSSVDYWEMDRVLLFKWLHLRFSSNQPLPCFWKKKNSLGSLNNDYFWLVYLCWSARSLAIPWWSCNLSAGPAAAAPQKHSQFFKILNCLTFWNKDIIELADFINWASCHSKTATSLPKKGPILLLSPKYLWNWTLYFLEFQTSSRRVSLSNSGCLSTPTPYLDK